jgi:hypothetical protein
VLRLAQNGPDTRATRQLLVHTCVRHAAKPRKTLQFQELGIIEA